MFVTLWEARQRIIDSARFTKEVEDRCLKRLAIYHGRKYGQEKEMYFKQAEAFVLPSFNEAFPLVNIEAMEYKLPIISTNVGGIPDEVTDNENGYIVKDKDSIGLADAIQRLLDDENTRYRMGAEGRRMFMEQFTMKCFEDNIKRILSDCIEVND